MFVFSWAVKSELVRGALASPAAAQALAWCRLPSATPLHVNPVHTAAVGLPENCLLTDQPSVLQKDEWINACDNWCPSYR